MVGRRSGVKSVGVLDPYERVEAETISWSEGVKTDRDKKFGIYVTSSIMMTTFGYRLLILKKGLEHSRLVCYGNFWGKNRNKIE